MNENTPLSMNSKSTRRNFIKNTSIAAVASISLPELVTSSCRSGFLRKVTVDKNDVILFQGDSITDWFRQRLQTDPNITDGLGSGYVLLAAGQLLLKYPEKDLKIFNRGITGNRTDNLADRWDNDCLALKPNILSVLIGVNDFYQHINSDYPGTVETYISNYRALLNRTLKALPNVKLIIGEPFGIKGIKEVNDKWYPAYNLYRKAARDIADEYHAAFVPFQTIFDKALELAPATYWTFDGIHPTTVGAALMARAWMEAIK